LPIVDFYCKKGCKSCQKARNWLDEKGVDYHYIDYVKQLPPRSVIEDALRKHGQGALRKRHKKFKDLKEAEPKVLLREIEADPNLLGRPILVWPDGSWVMGFGDDWEELFA